MKYLGNVDRVGYNGLLIVRSDFTPPLGEAVFGRGSAMIGKVKCIYGPVARPYLMVQPNPGADLLRLVGAELYVREKGEDHARRGRTTRSRDRKVSRVRKHPPRP